VQYTLSFCLPYLVIIIAIAWLASIGQWRFEAVETLDRIKLSEIFTRPYWEKSGRIIWRYTIGDNYTAVYTALSLFGMIIAFLKRKGPLNRYIIGWSAAIITHSMVFSDYINQHNYYQIPFLALICISSVYTLSVVPEIITVKRIPPNIFLLSLIFLAAAVSAPLMADSILRMHETVFPGLDVAGESLRGFTGSGERIFLLTHPQGQGIARYARRYVGWTEELDDFKDKEKRFKVRYICFYPPESAAALKARNQPLFEYIQNNYHVKEVGLTEEPSQLYYLILEKGEGSDPETFLQSFSGTRQVRAIYKLFGRYVFFYSLRPALEQTQK
jgi:hypothetical protein